MLLTLDVGNSQIHGGVFDGDTLRLQFRKTTQPIDVQMGDSEFSVLRWSPDGKWLAAGERKGRLTLFELVAR